jgi:S-layer homology domain
VRAVVAAVLSVIVLTAAAPAIAAPDEEHEPKLLGLADGEWQSTIPEFAAAVGKPPAFLQAFFPLDRTTDATFVQVQVETADTLGVTIYHEIIVDDLGSLNRGELDDDLAATAANYAAVLTGKRHLLVAPLPEANLGEHPWGGDPAGYRAGYRRIRQAFLDAGLGPEQVRFVFAMNGVSTVGSYSDYYPGDDVVDILGFARINRGDPWRDYKETFTTHIREMQSQISLDKPILITQTATVGGNGRADWLDDMFNGLLGESQVIGANYFSVSKDHDYRVIVGGSVDPNFLAGYRTWSPPSDEAWIFDGRMDAWVEERESAVFVDTIESGFRAEIEWLAGEGITEGCAMRRFCPDDPVTRAQMASFLDRALPLAASRGDAFEDDEGSVHEAAINRLAASGITKGCTGALYCPNDPVTRAQMASFLDRALDLPAASGDPFNDDEGSVHEVSINRLAAAGITEGCTPTSFCPNDPVTRAQMAAFLYRALRE